MQDGDVPAFPVQSLTAKLGARRSEPVIDCGIPPSLRMAPKCSLMRNTISTNSARMRATIHARAGAKHACDQKNHSDEWIVSHGRQRADRAGAAKEDRDDDSEPIKDLDHSGGYEPFPLEQITKTEHGSPRASRIFPVSGGHCTAQLRWSIARCSVLRRATIQRRAPLC